MTVIAELLRTHPLSLPVDRMVLVNAVGALAECGAACTVCADACLCEEHPDTLRSCVRLTLDCADVCAATGRVLTRLTGSDPTLAMALLTVCIQACKACATECALHTDMHEHCGICADSCRACDDACSQLLTALRQSLPDPA